jgi:TatD DNase family protein
VCKNSQWRRRREVKDHEPSGAKKVLEYFVAAARDQKKFVNLHTKAGEKEILDLLEKYDVQRAIIHWYSGPMDILRAMIQYGCYLTIGVEVLYSDYIKEIARTVPDHLLLTETDNPGALRWLKKTDEVGMPRVIEDVVSALAMLRQSTPDQIESLVQTNFSRLIAHDTWVSRYVSLVSPPGHAH